MIKDLLLKSGPAAGVCGQAIPSSTVTVFVGPNNSGKSRLLREIAQQCGLDTQHGGLNTFGDKHFHILDNLVFKSYDASEFVKLIANLGGTIQQDIHSKRSTVRLRHFFGKDVSREYDSLERYAKCSINDRPEYIQFFVRPFTLFLDGKGRLSLVNEQALGDLLDSSPNSLVVLFKDNILRQMVRQILHDAFGLFFVLDPTKSGHVRIRFSDREPRDELEECGFHTAAREFHSAAQNVESMSDGLKAFTEIIIQLVAGNPSILLIDEPEAFLHPSLAFKLGKEISLAALKSHKRVFASTHSSQFLMGCIQSGVPVNIVRLTYTSHVATSRVLENDKLTHLMRHPLLRSTNVILGLFYDFVIVTEADSDRVFYQEINERLLRFNPERGIPNCLFVNAQNKQTVHVLIEPLRRLGIPAAGIVDIDILKIAGSDWTNLLKSAGMPPISHQPLGQQRSAIETALVRTGKNMKRDGGLDLLQNDEKEAAQNFFDDLSQYGIFVVPGGELESWMKFLGAKGHGSYWLIDIFEKMGENPDDSEYLKPSADDVWAFLNLIRNWMIDPVRKGIPSK